MLFKQVKDLKFRKFYNKIEKLKQIRKFVFTNLLSNLINKKKTVEDRKRTVFLVYKLNLKLLSKVKIVRRCILTNRGRQIVRPYNISHSIFRNLNQLGLIPGCKKAVW